MSEEKKLETRDQRLERMATSKFLEVKILC